SQAIEDLEARYRAMDSPYMQERAGDIRELRRKVLLALVGEEAYTFKISEPSILVVEELGPAEVAGLDTSLVRGIITRKGGVTSHAAILAKALGIPAIVGLGDQFTSIIDGAQLAMDGTSGRVLAVKEHPNEVAQLKEQQWQNEETQVQLMRQASAPATTSDGKTFPILANVKDANGAKKAFVMGADGIGLLRTEFLYMNRTTPPSEEEQYRSYSSICRAMQGKPVTIRTLDVGGDKPIPYLGIPLEKNPFLGLRGIRYCLHESGQHLFRTQLRAICRVAAEFPVRLMYPMIGVVEEVKAANKLLAEVLDVLRAADIRAVRPQAVGIMIEVPSTAFCIPALAREADFFSIGTNDLTQYLLTLDRGNEMVATYRSALHPSVLEALQQIITAAKVCQIEIGMCGELAGNPKVTELLIQMGLDKFSMNAPAIPVVKDIVRQLDYAALTKRKQSISLLDNLAAVETALSERD
ncbi:MAG: phosphoenolpyruvate--protein phosphotransferase, partial [Bacteroidota bacterium]